MDAFPDELLLMVLGYIDNGLTLLDVVPLVCKRWHRLSRDPAAWTSVTETIVSCPYLDDDAMLDQHENHEEILDTARVIRHAPALRRVRFNWSTSCSAGPFSCRYDRETMTSALARSSAQVREIVFPQPELLAGRGSVSDLLEDPLLHMAPDEHSMLVDFLSKNSSYVRYLKLGHLLLVGTPLVSALGRCENLEELRLMIPDPDYFKYWGELRRRRLPKLKRLTLKSWYNPDHDHDCRAFLGDLFRCVAQSVRHVRCKELCEPSHDVLTKLSRCVELRSLRCGVEGVALARTMPRLRSLTLTIQCPDDGQQKVLSAAERALRRCGELRDLRELRLDSHYEFDGKWGADHRQALSVLLTTLGTKATNVKHFSTSGMLSRQVSPETLIAFFKSLPRLESVHIDRFRFDNLAQLAEVEGMKRFSGEVTYRKGEAATCHAAMEQFRRQRPDVDCRLTDGEYFF